MLDGKPSPNPNVLIRREWHRWGWQFSSRRRKSLKDQDIWFVVQLGPSRGLVVDEPFIGAAHKADTEMDRPPYRTVRDVIEDRFRKEEERVVVNEVKEEIPMTEEKAKPIDFDAEKTNELLDIIFRTKDTPAWLPINQAAMINLAIISADIQEQIVERAEEMKKEAA